MVAISGGAVRSHVQAFADKVHATFGITHIITYKGHQPSIDLALDIFANKDLGDRLAQFCIDNLEPAAIDYVIWWQRIYNPEVAPYWRNMADRGSITQNHKDHVHVSFEPTGSGIFVPSGDDDVSPQELLDTLKPWLDAIARIDADTDELSQHKISIILQKLDEVAGRPAGMPGDYNVIAKAVLDGLKERL